jgi:serine/threonine protein phosphatase PrpC
MSSNSDLSTQSVVLFSGVSDRGLEREENQDVIFHANIPMGDLMIVADGMGAFKGGATAAKMVVKGFHSFLSTLPRDYPVELALREASSRTNASILVAAREPNSLYQQMGSTVVVALVRQEAEGYRGWIGHIGDSRAYLVRAGRLTRLTTDHSVVQAKIDKGLITPEEALHDPDASLLNRTIGHQIEVEIEIDKCDLAIGDTLLLCSDGLWGCVAEQELQTMVADENLPVETATHKLLELALAAGGKENIGIEMARLAQPHAVSATSNVLVVRVLQVLVGVVVLAICGLLLALYLLVRN